MMNTFIKKTIFSVFIWGIFLTFSIAQNSKKTINSDICIYTGTASGVMAAVSAAEEGLSVIIIEPSRWIGGMTGGGISTIDWGNEDAVGGTTLTILKNKYTNAEYRKVFKELINKNNIRVIYEHRLAHVIMVDSKISSISLDFAPPDSFGCPIPFPIKTNSMYIKSNVYIDCSYEGDLMAMSGVSYTYGRESKDEYSESLAGAEPTLNIYDIDPYIVEGDSLSGLLPLLQNVKPQPIGTSDKLTMGYALRYKFDLSGNGIPIPKPDSYDPKEFEIFRRGFLNGLDLSRAKYMKKLGKMKAKKGYFISKNGAGNTNRSILTTTIWGINRNYPDGDWQVRAKIWKFHIDYFKNIIHFLKTDTSVPQHLHDLASTVTFQKGIFDDTGGWPYQFYVREARRMISSYVITQSDIEGKADTKHTVGLASYGVDEWPYALIPFEGNKIAIYGGQYSEMVINDNSGIYKIPYESIVPKTEECKNLIVPVCVSASHIALTSIRMEPVWMILGESAGKAASLAVKNDVSVQDVDYQELKNKLLEVEQKFDAN